MSAPAFRRTQVTTRCPSTPLLHARLIHARMRRRSAQHRWSLETVTPRVDLPVDAKTVFDGFERMSSVPGKTTPPLWELISIAKSQAVKRCPDVARRSNVTTCVMPVPQKSTSIVNVFDILSLSEAITLLLAYDEFLFSKKFDLPSKLICSIKEKGLAVL
jgi:hypothetical protein